MINARLTPSRLRSPVIHASFGEARRSALGAKAARYMLAPSRYVFVLVIAAFAAGCSSEPKTSAPAQLAPSTSQHAAIGQLPPIDIDAVLRHTKALSADEFEGRAPGGKGEEPTVNYLVDAFRKIGLKPGNTDGTYTQKVPLVGITGAEARPL